MSRLHQIGARVKRGLRKSLKSVYHTKQNVRSTAKYSFNLDSPRATRIDKSSFTVEGWLIPKANAEVVRMRAILNKKEWPIQHGLKRPDVAKAFPAVKNKAALSGFMAELDSEDGTLTIEVDFGGGYTVLHSGEVHYSPEKLVRDYYNPNLAQSYAQHLNLLDNRQKYVYEPGLDTAYEPHVDDPRLVAFYLPQYHPIPANDKAWGKGFTEWTNVTADTPRFVGHQQPILPGDLGFYDLRYEDTMLQQIELAKRHGIHGFCFYYYWFSGNRLLEQPLDSFLRHQEWNFNFTICWANENWTKRWDGRNSDIILAQKYAPEDPLKFIKDVEFILLDERYIRQDGKPVLTVFRASELKDPSRYAEVWREYFWKKHKLELYLVSCLSFEDTDPRTYGFDAALDFAPQSAFFKNDCFKDGKYPYSNVVDRLIDPSFEGSVADYRTIALNKRMLGFFDFPTLNCVTPAWDNDARKKGKGFVMRYSNPDIYGRWLHNALKQSLISGPSPLVFINAWNEWAEGAVLEPTRHEGHAVLNRTTEVLASFSKNIENMRHFPLYGMTRTKNVELAIVIHLFYPEKWEYLKEKLANVQESYDLFVTLNEKDSEFTEQIYKFKKNTKIIVVPNRGRDVLPFVILARRLETAGYKYFLKLHTKKSKHRDDGSEWFDEVIANLLPSSEGVATILRHLKSGTTSMIGPSGHIVSLRRHMGSNELHLQDLLARIYSNQKAKDVLANRDHYSYFGGTMFWGTIEVIRPLLELYLLPEDFEAEEGQIDGTMAHAVERAFGILAHIQGSPLQQSSSEGITDAIIDDPGQKYTYAP